MCGHQTSNIACPFSPGLDLPVAEAREPLSKTPYTTDPHFEDGGTLVTCERDSEMAK